jgi:hypothetical protein
MTVTSTEFQQNIGYYLKLAEKGTVVTIVKTRPRRSQYQLKVVRPDNPAHRNSRLEKFLKKVEQQGSKFDYYGKDSVKFVRSIRK